MANKQTFCNNCKANGVQTEIFFSPSVKSASGKMIPIEMATKQNHNCPFRPKFGQASPAAQVVAAAAPATAAAPKEPSVSDNALSELVLKGLKDIKIQLDRIEQTQASLVMGAAQETTGQ